MMPMPTDDPRQAAYTALTERILKGDGRAPHDLRRRAFSNVELSEPLRTLLAKVATTPTQVTEADFVAARAAGFSEDQIFELVICAAVGQSTRLYETGLAALAEATAQTGVVA